MTSSPIDRTIGEISSLWPIVKRHHLAPDWAKKELSVEFELLCNRLYRLENEHISRIYRAHYGNLLEEISDEDYWKQYVNLITTIREYVYDPSDALKLKLNEIDYSLRYWRKRSPAYA